MGVPAECQLPGCSLAAARCSSVSFLLPVTMLAIMPECSWAPIRMAL